MGRSLFGSAGSYTLRYNLRMGWASRRRATYLFGMILFFSFLIATPLTYWYFNIPSTCDDGIQNQGETAPDKGGPCFVLDERTLQREAVLWARSFRLRDGLYNAVAYINNPNAGAGVAQARYRFGLYDSDNIMITEREGVMYIMPGGTTPVLEGRIDVGNRRVAHTYFEFVGPFVWEMMKTDARVISVRNKDITDISTVPRLSAIAQNDSVTDVENIAFIATIFDSAGNAFAASATSLSRLNGGASSQIIFTWPSPFTIRPSRIDITPLVAPALLTAKEE